MNKNAKGMATNSLKYTGIVRLSQYINGKKHKIAEIHNEGGKALFNFLAECLLGDVEIAQVNKPTKILLLNKNEDGALSIAGESDFIQMLTLPERVYSEDTVGVVRYSFMIPQEYFAGTAFNAIGLYAKSATVYDLQDYAAFCEVKADQWTLSISSVLILDWELRISNSPA